MDSKEMDAYCSSLENIIKSMREGTLFNADGTMPLNPRYQEILRLHEMLNESAIPHVLDRLYDGWRVSYPVAHPDPGLVCSAIEHFGLWYAPSDDRIEIMGLLMADEATDGHTDVTGWLSAEDVFERIKEHWEANGHG